MGLDFTTSDSEHSHSALLAKGQVGQSRQPFEILIAGAGVVGLALALELKAAGADVAVCDAHAPGSGSSHAAAGMLAVNDPHNPPALRPLARYSRSLYDGFLHRIQELSGNRVPFQTHTTVQYFPDGSAHELAEESLDPRELMHALITAIHRAGISVFSNTSLLRAEHDTVRRHLRLPHGEHQACTGPIVFTAGAWSALAGVPVRPRKGQMLRVAMNPGITLTRVHRAEHVYIVPRTAGSQNGSALVGATVEDAGFDITVERKQLQYLRDLASELSSETAFVRNAPELEAWAGLRPATLDDLPLIGAISETEWIATGHYRNGILLAPGTARIIATLLSGKPSSVNLQPFDPLRFQSS